MLCCRFPLNLLSPTLQSSAVRPRLMPWVPGTLSYAQFSRPLLMPFPPPAMPFLSSPLVLYLNILYGSNHITSSLKDFPIPEGMTVLPLSTTAEFSGEVCSGAYGVFFLHVCSSPYVHTSLDSTDCASQKALKNHQNKTGHLLNLSPPLYTLYVTYVISNPGKNSAKQSISISQNEN